MFALAGDTDGVDGAEEIAGAIVTPDTLTRAIDRGINAKARLADNDGHSFFEALGDQIITGPTLTNVNDFRAILILQAKESRPVKAATKNAPSPQRPRSSPPSVLQAPVRTLFVACLMLGRTCSV